MTEVSERVARLESQTTDTRNDVSAIWKALAKSAQTTQEIATQLAALVALSRTQHTPETCPYRGDIRECREALWFARGGGKVVLWLIGGGLLSMGTLLGLVIRG